MPRFDAFCGGFDTPFSPNIQSEWTMNWLPERNSASVEGQGDVHDKNVRCSLIRLPGLKTFVTLPQAPCRGVFPGEFRLFAVGGAHFYEVKLVSGSPTIIDRSTAGFSGASGMGPAGGTIGNDMRPAQCFFNGNQAVIISAGNAYVDNGNGPVPAQFSEPLTDLIVDPAHTDGAYLTTALGDHFDQSDVGRTIMITSNGGGWTFGTSQVIQSVTTSSDPVPGLAVAGGAWGTPGANLGTGVEFLGGYTWNDLSLPSGFGGYVIASAGHMFGPADVGITINITGSTSGGFTVGTYKVTGLVVGADGNPNGEAILNASAGTAGSGGGSGSTPTQAITASQGSFLDGYFFVSQAPPTKDVNYSGAPDGTSDGTMWDPGNFISKSDYPDNVTALFADHEELYTFGDLESTEVWRDVGSPPPQDPFMPDPGAFLHWGCQSPFSVVRLGNGVAWIAQDTRRGTRKAIHSVGFQPTVVSTPAVSAAWAQYLHIDDAVAFTISFNGHELWVINFPSADATWFYDPTTQFWGRWGYWNNSTGDWEKIRPWVHCVVALDGFTDVHYGGDYSTGQIYVISMAYKTDDGNPIVRRRRAPHLTNENQRRFYARFEVDCDVLGKQRVFWNRLGNGRDRIWQLDTAQYNETGGATLTLGWSDDRTQSFQSVLGLALDPSVDVQLANAYLKWVDATWN